ncbi:MAG: hypothetical protein IPM49_02315 [Flavobacteriales bacterium]|nr:hypothetical protein [Flavobacteriales bacterium]
MHQQYVDHFFRTGELKLSSYESNRIIEDAVRRDHVEGTGDYVIVSRDRRLSYRLGARAFDQRMLCMSTSSNLDRMMSHFGVDGCFEVTNTTGFGFEIAKALVAFRFGREGVVTYQDGYEKIFLLENHPHLLDLTLSAPSNEQLFSYIDIIGRTDFDMLFTKPLQFQDEEEYRFNWLCAPKHPMLIRCPGALKYCRKIT